MQKSTTCEYSTKAVVCESIDRLLKMGALIGNTPEIREREARNIIDAIDIIDGLELVREKFHATATMLNKPGRHKQKAFNFIGDVKEEIRCFYMSGNDKKQEILRKRQYNGLVSLVLEPVIDAFRHGSHKDALANVDAIIDDAISYTTNNNIVARHPDDVIVTRSLVSKALERKQEVRAHAVAILKLRMAKKKRKSKARDLVVESD